MTFSTTRTALPARDGAAARPRIRVGRLSAVDVGLIAAIVTLVCVVSLPRLEEYARRTNEADARTAIVLLGETWIEDPRAAAPGRDLPALVADDPHVSHRLRDARRVPGTAILLHHGYYLRLAEDGRSIVAWPRRAGRTGERAFRYRAGQGLAVHANLDERWSGVEPPREPGSGWRTAR